MLSDISYDARKARVFSGVVTAASFESGLLELSKAHEPHLLIRNAMRLLVERTGAREALIELTFDEAGAAPLVVC